MRRWSYLIVSILLGAIVLAWFPLGYLPVFPHYDAVMHFLAGSVIALFFAALVPRADDSILLTATIIGFLWEPIEAIIFGIRTIEGMIGWIFMEDTVLDITLVFVGAFLSLRIARRYR